MFPIIIGLSVEISDNPTKRLTYFRFYGNSLQKFKLQETRIEKQENLHFRIENKQDLQLLSGGPRLRFSLLQLVFGLPTNRSTHQKRRTIQNDGTDNPSTLPFVVSLDFKHHLLYLEVTTF